MAVLKVKVNGEWQEIPAIVGPAGPQGIPGAQGDPGEQGIQGEAGKGIFSFEKTGTSSLTDTYRMTYTDGSWIDMQISNGKGIRTIAKTGTSGNVDTYTITFNDNTTMTFTVTNANIDDTAGAGVTNKTWSANKLSQQSAEVDELKSALQDIGNPPNLRKSTEENVDLDIADENGNVLARFSNGDIHTKNFSSARILKCKLTNTENVDLDISDIFGNVVARFSGGHIKTKNFDSSDMTVGPLKGKVVVNFGDSIFGNRRAPNDISTAIANATGATVYNCGFGGCRMAAYVSSGLSTWGQFSMFELADAIVENDWSGQDAAVADTGWTNMPSYFPDTLSMLKSIDFSTVDIVTIAYGANDFNGAVVVDDDQNPLSTSTFSGALRYSIEKLLTAYPQLRIFCLGQIYGWYSGNGGVFVDDTNTHELNGQKLSDFIEATEKVAHEYNLPFINNYNIGIGKFTRYQYLVDTSHPNQAGTDLMAEHIVNELF